MNDQLEKEQLEALKSWWKENGTQVLVVGCIAAIVYFGYNWWQSSNQTKLNNVSTLYEQYLQEISIAAGSVDPTDDQVKTVNFLTDQLVDEYGDSHYAFLATLNTAAFDVRRGAWELALTRLGWAEQYADTEADQQLVNYRVALLQAQLGEVDTALDMLQGSNEHFASIYAEARGDILLGSDRREEALAEYETASATVPNTELVRITALNAKIDNLKNNSVAVESQEGESE